MKKIIMVMCALALGSAVHAASVGWSLANMMEQAGDAYSFFVIGQKGVESADQISALCAGGKDVSDFMFGSGTVNNKGMAMVAATASGKTLDAGTTYESFFVIFDAGKQSDAQNYVLISSKDAAGLKQSPGATAGTITFAGGNASSIVGTASNWSKVQGSGVPEPTSGLLLLMGMAALALKRKVA